MHMHYMQASLVNGPCRSEFNVSKCKVLQVSNSKCTLEIQRSHSHLLLLFKILNHHIFIPDQYIPVRNPLQTTRCDHLVKLTRPYTRTDIYQYSCIFSSDNSAMEQSSSNISNLHQLNLQELKTTLIIIVRIM
mgnify:CR=1 FL=1